MTIFFLIFLDVLVQALFFARWCNRDHTLTKIDSSLLHSGSKLEKKFEKTLIYFCICGTFEIALFSILEHCDAI